MTIKEALETFEGDKRTKEYKNILEHAIYPLEDYRRLKSLKGKAEWEDIKLIFKLDNEIFNTRDEPCKCPGIIRRKLVRLIKKWERVEISNKE